jgi:endonuclease YncB( thermonuclease family)
LATVGVARAKSRHAARIAALGVVAMLAAGVEAEARTACPTAGTETVAVAAVEPRLVLRLEDGRLIRLSGLDPALSTPDAPDRDDVAREALAALVGHGAIGIAPLAAMPDRWGRITALAFRADAAAGAPRDLAVAAIAAGLGRYLAEPAAHGCRAALVAAEDQARAQKLGLWADPYYAVLAVDDRAGFAERAGTLVVAEGRLAAVETGPMRDTLIFSGQRDEPGDVSARGSRSGHTLSATIAPHVRKIIEARGVHVSSLIGRTLRLRGLLDMRFGPRIELGDPDDFDVLASGGDGIAPAGAAGSALAGAR